MRAQHFNRRQALGVSYSETVTDRNLRNCLKYKACIGALGIPVLHSSMGGSRRDLFSGGKRVEESYGSN